MNVDRYIRLLKAGFLTNLALMVAVLVDFLYLEQRFVTPLVVLYAALVTALIALWGAHEGFRRGRPHRLVRRVDGLTGPDTGVPNGTHEPEREPTPRVNR